MQVLVSGKDMKYLYIVYECSAVVTLTAAGTVYIFTAPLSPMQVLHVIGCHF
jgi:hypothetical protein